MFSQSFLCGVNLGELPFLASRPNEVVWDSMCVYVTKEMEKHAATAVVE
jgi:hypothetical protein